VDALLSFAATVVSLRLAALLVRRFRARREVAYAAWAGALLAYAIASAALAWSAAAGWSSPSFRVYYLFGGLLTAALLGAGSLLLAGHGWARPLVLVYTGIAIGVALAMPVEGAFAGDGIPEAQAHLSFFPARLLAIMGNSAGTLAVVAVALLTLRRRPLANALILAGVTVAAAGSGLSGLGVTSTALFTVVGAGLLYAGFVAPAWLRR
jgi:hypothetical protein